MTSPIGMASSKGRIVNQENSGTEGVGLGEETEDLLLEPTLNVTVSSETG